MISKIKTCSIVDSVGTLVMVETDVHNGLPDFKIVGATSVDVKDARERVRVGIENTGFILPPKRITVSLVPAPLKKTGTGFDLAIAVSVLSSFGFINNENLSEYLVLGEVALDGSLRAVNGTLFSVLFGKSIGINKFLVPAESLPECAYLEDSEVYGFNNLYDLAVFLNGDRSVAIEAEKKELAHPEFPAFSDISGQRFGKIALVTAVTGGHTCMIIGGSKDIRHRLMNAAAAVLPVSRMEILHKAAYRGVFGDIDFNDPDILGNPIYAFKDLKAFKEKQGRIGNFNGCMIALEDSDFDIGTKVDFYSFYNCRCRAESPKNCICSPKQIRDRQIYIKKIKEEKSDIAVTLDDSSCISDDTLRLYAENALKCQEYRFKSLAFKRNADIPDKDIETYCSLTHDAVLYMDNFVKENQIVIGEKNKILRIARTVADTSLAEEITEDALKSAIKLRGVYE